MTPPRRTDGWTVQIVTDTGRLDAVKDAWRAAAVRTGNAFMTPEWFFSFLEHARHARPFVLMIEEQGELRGLLPLVEYRRVLRFPGAEVGDCYQPLAIGASDGEIIDCAVVALAADAERWKLVFFNKVENRVAERLRTTWRDTSLRVVTSGSYTLPAIELGTRTWDEYLQARSHNFRSEIRRKERALARAHDLQFVEVRGGDELAEALAVHFALHDKRWSGRGAVRPVAPWVRPFVSSFVLGAAREGWLRLWRLTVDDEAVASWCGWSIGGRYCYYQAGLDIAWSRFSPGTLLLARTIRASIEEGCSAYDLLLGDEAYKRRFSDGGRYMTTLVAASGLTPRLAIEAGRWRLRLGARRLPPEMKRVLRSMVRGRWS